MHTIRKLAREIHRRSVWQVVAVYMTGGWVAYRVVALATEQVGLPEWTPTMALVLLALGFPVVTATAVVQGGLPWLRIVDWADPNELEGRTPAEVHVIPHLHPLYRAGLFTWRNAVLGGVMALALLVTSVVAYLTMWALGIGPVGSLLAQGVIAADDHVMVADFENRTDRAWLGPALTQALLLDLSESTLVRVVGRRPRPVSSDDTGEASAAIAASNGGIVSEEGVRALVQGRISRTEAGYGLTVGILVPPSTTPLARFHEDVTGEHEMVAAIDILSERVRAKLGESLRAIRAGRPLSEIYGPSLVPGFP